MLRTFVRIEKAGESEGQLESTKEFWLSQIHTRKPKKVGVSAAERVKVDQSKAEGTQ